MENFDEKTCPQCLSVKLKSWTELTDEQKFLVERLPRNTEFTPDERKKHRFCDRCWFEEITPKLLCG
jgi:hypothetical protein